MTKKKCNALITKEALDHIKWHIRHLIIWLWPIITLAITQYQTTWAIDLDILYWILISQIIDIIERLIRK